MSSPLATPPVYAKTPAPAQTPGQHRPPGRAPASTASTSTDVASTPPLSALSSVSSARRPSNPPPVIDASRKLIRNVSPGLLARMQFLNQTTQDTARSPVSQIGRIPENTIRELDDFHKDRTVRIERRGTTWTTPTSRAGTPLLPQLTGESVTPSMLSVDQSPPPGFDSDRSSLVSTSDRVLPSDSEAEDTQKYRLPDLIKTKTLSQPLPDTPSSSEPVEARPPTPPPKDDAPAPEASVLDADDGIDVAAYFHRRQFSRANSIYTLSRASFTNQIQQLTSITLPHAPTLSSSISAIPTSTAAGRALHEAANQIKLWMAKATEVLNGLDAEDDVEWAAAAGREGLEEVDAAIGKFEGLVTVYITAIEDLQSRPDIGALPARDLTRLVSQMEDVVNGWTTIKKTLKDIKTQVEIAMEWEELWNSVLGEIGHEIENLSRLVFEMEERRHRAISDSVAESAEKFDIADLETIVEETPRMHTRVHSNRFNLATPTSQMSPISPIPQIEKENSRLLALFAKLQPLRASLDFLPMRLSSFQMRASRVFPSACDELLRRRDQLENLEKKLEADADALRDELGEDKWVHSFRQAGSKAVAMYDSLMKSIQRLHQAIDENDEEKLGARISAYKDKREHYPPSMKRVLELIDIEMKHRSTVNGEILRIQQDVRQKVTDLQQETMNMDALLEEFTSSRKLRDSVSTVLSGRTDATTSALETPNSSPASSVIMGRRSSDYGRVTPSGTNSRQASTSSSKSSLPPNRRYSGLPMSTLSNNVPRKSMTGSRLESGAYAGPPRTMSATPTGSVRSSTTTTTSSNTPNKPRWNSSTNLRDTVIGHHHRPTPSPQKREIPTPRNYRSASSQSAIPVRSPLSQNVSPPTTTSTRSASATHTIPRRPVASTLQPPTTPAKGRAPLASRSTSTLPRTPMSASTRRTPLPEECEDALDAASNANDESPSARRMSSRPASAMNGRRSSMLPMPKQRSASGSSFSSLTGGAAPPAPRSNSRLGAIDESANSRSRSRMSLDVGATHTAARAASRAGGRMSSMGGEGEKRWR